MTPDGIITKMQGEIPFDFPEHLRPYIKEAMQIYADQEAKLYYSWICNQVIAGRTSQQLWNDYKETVIDEEKLIRQLFIGKVSELIGQEKTVELLKEATEAIKPHLKK